MGGFGMGYTMLSCMWACLMLAMMPNPGAAQLSYLIDCGAVDNITVDGRQWMGQSSGFRFLSASGLPILANTSNSSGLSPSIAPLLTTASIFTAPAVYSFPVSVNTRYWLRLYFFPFLYQQFNPSSSVFSVSAGGFTLFPETRIIGAIESRNYNKVYLIKEYCINATQNSLVLQFTPDGGDGSYAFINAIEVVSLQADFFTDSASPLGMDSPKAVGIPNLALETMYRLNVGGPFVGPGNDSVGLYRTWLADELFLLSSVGVEHVNTSSASIKYSSDLARAIAPPIVYATALQAQKLNAQSVNMSWVFPIDADYAYLVRMHFCDLVYSTGGKRHFNVYIQNQTAYSNLDLGLVVGADGPYYRDFYLDMQRDATSLWIQAGPPPSNLGDAVFTQAIANGIEIWKLNDARSGEHIASSKSKIGLILGAAFGGLAVLSIALVAVCVLCKWKKKTKKHKEATWVPLTLHGMNASSLGNTVSVISHKSGAGSLASSAGSTLGRVFSFAEISSATHNFTESWVVGVGGFGKVYFGELDDGTKVAVKRGNPQSQQGIMEFRTEIDMLSKLRHRHLVSLIGYCEEHREMILVYEYMANGTLRSHLYGSDLPPLSWLQRLEICIGAARGLHYLHTGASQSIIHRDVKTTNILLDESLVAKVADFGLSKTGPTLEQTHVTTAVKGSFGYLDPEYFRRQQLTEKSDVYSFGVVLLEVLCARPAINPALPRNEVNIAEWAMHWKSIGKLEHIIDPHLAGMINRQSLAKYGETVERCLAEEGIHRPTIGDVLWTLEYCLQLQQTSMANAADDDSTN